MFILAIDQSTATGSAALLNDQRLVAARRWQETRALPQQFFPSLQAMLRETGLEISAIELYVVGVGPGYYSSLRTALAAVRAMALPGKTAVYGITSAEALAWQVAQAEHVTRVRIVGDARREQWWTRLFLRQADFMSPTGDWELVDPPATLARSDCLPAVPSAQPMQAGGLRPGAFQVGEAEAVATPDWTRLGARLPALVQSAVRLITGALIPEAETLGRLALARLAQGIASEPLAPIYLHPAVRGITGSCQAPGHAL
ncbi:MAG: tRNA (adenosine(37)-N6)-threonylcarbamoyltransferase complex dimerization subunit type 1 TsaB [Lentisphaerae bacterium]|nr:tRNA (adenosine(37)-N6)-threonylcarbamoyltransferase complex dimerization subunit type 1 TsaB [Lentisphaerota bacterium]